MSQSGRIGDQYFDGFGPEMVDPINRLAFSVQNSLPKVSYRRQDMAWYTSSTLPGLVGS
jgi:hypothetical protein